MFISKKGPVSTMSLLGTNENPLSKEEEELSILTLLHSAHENPLANWSKFVCKIYLCLLLVVQLYFTSKERLGRDTIVICLLFSFLYAL